MLISFDAIRDAKCHCYHNVAFTDDPGTICNPCADCDRKPFTVAFTDTRDARAIEDPDPEC